MDSDLSNEEKEILQDRAKRREFLRQVFLKEKTNPFAHMKGEGGHVLDPALQRYQAMKQSNFDFFRPTSKNAFLGVSFLLAPFGVFFYLIYNQRNDREQKLRRGEVPYKNRTFKFI